MTNMQKMQDLVVLLNKASNAYYNTGDTIMTDQEFDKKFEELKALEKEIGIILSNSPTHRVGATVQSKLNKVKHIIPMLSLDKCHNTEELIKFAGNDDCYMSVKCDGLSTRLSYTSNGTVTQLTAAETRGDGEIGVDVLEHVKQYVNVPMTIPCTKDFVIDGESVIFQSDFENICANSPNTEYKNPRNLASGTLASLDTSVVKDRHMKFIAWRVIQGLDGDSNFNNLKTAETFGFWISPMYSYSNNSDDKKDIVEMLNTLKETAQLYGLPMDGIVMAKDSIDLSASMGRTGKFFRHSIAYKFEDQQKTSTLIGIDWTVGKTGIITPTAMFSPIELEGTTIERASVHNISILTKLDLHKGDTIELYKANMIIPQINRNISSEKRRAKGIESDYIIIPSTCPICNGATELIKENETTVLMCTNPNCQGRLLGKLIHFVSRKAMNIDNLSEATLDFLINKGWVKQFTDLYYLRSFRDKWVKCEGFGAKSVDNILGAIETSRKTKLESFISALSIPNVGISTAKMISAHFNGDFNAFKDAFEHHYNWAELEDVGSVTASEIDNYFEVFGAKVVELANEMQFVEEEKKEVKENPFVGKSVCVTGKLEHFTRDSINAKITELGAKVAFGVTAKTDFLVTNTPDSGSSKNANAKKFGTKIITEKDFLNMIGE